MTYKRESINKLLGISKSGEVVYVHEFHWNGVSLNCFDYLTSAMIEERNDLDTVIDMYGYLWSEAVADGLTDLSQKEYMQDVVDGLQYDDAYFLGHDTSYTYHITREDTEVLSDHYGTEIEAFECVGGGTVAELKRDHFEIIFDQELFDRAVAHEQAIMAAHT